MILGLIALVQHLWRRQKETKLDLAATRGQLVRQMRETEHFRMAVEHASDGLVIQELDGSLVWANPAYCRILGRELDEMVGRNPLEYAFLPEEIPSEEEIRNFRYDPQSKDDIGLKLRKNIRSDGTSFWNQINVSYRKSATGMEHAILVCRDVTEQIERDQKLQEIRCELEFAASHDGLTGVSNRHALMRYTEEILLSTHQRGACFGLLHLDLDEFKAINDTHGHSAGDAALKHVARVLKENVRNIDMVARVGGDEFVVVCPGVKELEALQEVADKLLVKVQSSFAWGDRTLNCGVSIGAALSDRTTSDPENLLIRADFALYEAKRSGRNQVAMYDEGLHQRHAHETQRASELIEVVGNRQLTHFFQPTLNIETGEISGLETLVRWKHPVDGMISPADFLPMAEQLGLMADIDFASIDAALNMKVDLQQAGHPNLKLAFNASGNILEHPDFVSRLMRGVLGRGIDPHHVVIEVLETIVFGDMTDSSVPVRIIEELRDAGFRIMLDDFGVGYAGLAHLAKLAVTGVKIDQSLVRNILIDDTSSKIVSTIIELCFDLGLDVIAEGVETHDVAGRLHELGCVELQGYWLSKPLDTETLQTWFDAGENTDSSERFAS